MNNNERRAEVMKFEDGRYSVAIGNTWYYMDTNEELYDGDIVVVTRKDAETVTFVRVAANQPSMDAFGNMK